MKTFIIEAKVIKEISAASKEDAEDKMNDLMERFDQATIIAIDEVPPADNSYKEGE